MSIVLSVPSHVWHHYIHLFPLYIYYLYGFHECYTEIVSEI
jgi:hypothetical protein